MAGDATLSGRLGRRAQVGTAETLMPGVIAALLLLGLFDLAMTVHFMTTSGMIELNPLARYVVEGGPAALSMFKVSLMTLNAAFLWVARGRPLAKAGAGASLLVMARLGLHWLEYVSFLTGEGAGVADGLELAMADEGWVRF